MADAKKLAYFDNANHVPAPVGTPVRFNEDQKDIWLGYDEMTGELCVTNYNRTVIIVCFSPGGGGQFAVEIRRSGITYSILADGGTPASYSWNMKSRVGNITLFDGYGTYAVENALFDNAGSPAAGMTTSTVRIFPEANAGNAVYGELCCKVTDTSGKVAYAYFTVFTRASG
jgi:hypothetical protein